MAGVDSAENRYRGKRCIEACSYYSVVSRLTPICAFRGAFHFFEKLTTFI